MVRFSCGIRNPVRHIQTTISSPNTCQTCSVRGWKLMINEYTCATHSNQWTSLLQIFLRVGAQVPPRIWLKGWCSSPPPNILYLINIYCIGLVSYPDLWTVPERNHVTAAPDDSVLWLIFYWLLLLPIHHTRTEYIIAMWQDGPIRCTLGSGPTNDQIYGSKKLVGPQGPVWMWIYQDFNLKQDDAVNVHNRADWPVLFATFGISNIGFDN